MRFVEELKLKTTKRVIGSRLDRSTETIKNRQENTATCCGRRSIEVKNVNTHLYTDQILYFYIDLYFSLHTI